MVVAQANYTTYITLIGTISEVMTALASNGVPAHKVISIFYNGTNMTAVYSL